MWSILLRPWKVTGPVAIVMSDGFPALALLIILFIVGSVSEPSEPVPPATPTPGLSRARWLSPRPTEPTAGGLVPEQDDPGAEASRDTAPTRASRAPVVAAAPVALAEPAA